MRAGRVYVIGGGLAGLSAAVWLARSGYRVQICESSGGIGGRCRSFDDPTLGRRIDNGNHMVLSGNHTTMAFLAAIGAQDRMVGPASAQFDFVDVLRDERWRVRPGTSRLPWWLLSARRRVPGSRARDYLGLVRLALAKPQMTVTACLPQRTILSERFIEPLVHAVLNAPMEAAAAALLRPVLLETFGRGEAACRPLMARDSLGHCFIEPAIRVVEDAGGRVHTLRRVRALELKGDRVSALRFGSGEDVDVMPDDHVVLAVPPDAAAELLLGVKAPKGSNAIINGHFLLPESRGEWGMVGIIGGFSQWIFVRRDMASVTVSSADGWIDHAAPRLAARMWPEVCQALNLGERPLPRYRIIKEKRATFAQTPANLTRRANTRTRWGNLFLAGDWTDTGLPATIEGSLRSGQSAADAILARAASA